MPSRFGYSGAGVLLVDPSKNQIILVQDHTNQFNDAGGKVDNSSTKLSDLAAKELYEESRASIRISGRDLWNSDVDIQAGNSKYKCYIYRSSNISCRQFYANAQVVRNWGSCYNETTRMTRFPIQQIKNHYFAYGVIPYNIISDNGESCSLHGRVRRVLEQAIRLNRL
jgi:hypothetical protein